MVFVSINEAQEKRMVELDSFIEYLDDHEGTFESWVAEQIDDDDREAFIDYCSENPFIAYHITKQHYEYDDNKDKINYILNLLGNKHTRGKLLMIVGKKGSGKSALALYLAYLLSKLGEDIWWIGPPVKLPPFVKKATFNHENLPPNITCIIDEAALQFFSREAMQLDQIDFIKRLPTIRHAGRNFIVITQDVRLSDVNFLRNCDAVIFKTYALMQDEKKTITIHQELVKVMPNKISECLYYDNNCLLYFDFPLERWWIDAYSKPYAPFETPADGYRYLIHLIQDLESDEEISSQMSLKGFSITGHEVTKHRMLLDQEVVDRILALPDSKLIEFIETGFDDTPLNVLAMSKGEGMRIRCNFELEEIHQEIVNRELAKDEEQLLYSEYNINRKFYREMLSRQKEKNLVLSVMGLQGTGKSEMGIALAIFLGIISKRGFDGTTIYFTIDELLNDLPNLTKGDTVVLDEQVKVSGAGTGYMLQELHNIEETLRIEQINFIFISPSLRAHTHMYVLEPMGLDKQQEIGKVWLKNPSNNQLIGYITLAKPHKNVMRKYTPSKKQFAAKVKSRELTHGGVDIDKWVKKVLAHPDWQYATNRETRWAVVKRIVPGSAEMQSTVKAMAEIEMKKRATA